MSENFVKTYLDETAQIITLLDHKVINQMVQELIELRQRSGRLFILGVGGSAANASHAVNDFRKLTGIEAYAPTDNVAELSARTNDEGWGSIFVEWLRVSRLNSSDLVFVLSVGGGDLEKNISPNIVKALQYAQEHQCPIIGIIGREHGFTAQIAKVCLKIPVVNQDRLTPHSEAMQAVVWHLFVSHPLLQSQLGKWESVIR